MLHVTTTCPDLNCAVSIARAALDRRLAACANMLPGVVSLFHWQGRIDEQDEVQLVFKTRAALRDQLVALIETQHPYDVPVITWQEVEATGPAQMWLETETSGDG